MCIRDRGSALLKDPLLVGKIVEKMAHAIDKPLTVKIRIGFDESCINAEEIAYIIQESGGAAVAVHGRTRSQYYSGKADWDVIRLSLIHILETRATILGYMQRGGSPTCKDRMYASIMGSYAVDLLVAGKSNRLVAYKNGKFVDYDIDEALAMTKDISEYEFNISSMLSN